jgi:S-(hydroxymethyl)glutathione dehydrogenase/alcohol dehydrogenase
MKTRGAVLLELGTPWSIEDIEIGAPQRGEVLVRMVAAGLCHSDYHFNTGDLMLPTPMVGGHEGAGVVEEVGPGVEGFEVGDHVITAFIPSCGECRWCVTGRGQLCDRGATMMSGTALDGTRRVHVNGEPAGAMTWTGTFAEYAVAPKDSLIKIDKDVPLETVVLVSCGVPTGWGSAVAVADVQPGETVVVVGAGGVGMNAVQGAAYAGAEQLVVVEPVEWKRQKALDVFGATHAAASIDEAFSLVGDLTGGVMADKVLLHVDVLRGHLIQPALSLTAKGGALVCSASAPVAQNEVQLNLVEFVSYEKQIRGSLYGGLQPKYSIKKLVDLYRRGSLKLDELITSTYSLDDINQGYRDMEDGKNLRGALLHSSSDKDPM